MWLIVGAAGCKTVIVYLGFLVTTECWEFGCGLSWLEVGEGRRVRWLRGWGGKGWVECKRGGMVL